MESRGIEKLPTAKEREVEDKFFGNFEGLVQDLFSWLACAYNIDVNYLDMHRVMGLDGAEGCFIDRAKSFDDKIVTDDKSPLWNEIATNLNNLNENERGRYVFSLLKPFKEYGYYMNLFERKTQHGGIDDLEKEMEEFVKDYMWDWIIARTLPNMRRAKFCKQLIDVFKEKVEWGVLQILICRAIDKVFNEGKGELDFVDDRESLKPIEAWLQKLWNIAGKYAKRLDALLLERGINLMWYQEQSGIYILSNRDVTQLEWYLGSHKLARKYIEEATPKTETCQNINKDVLKGGDFPSRLTKDEALYYNKAIENGWAQESDNGYKWLYNKGSKASLAYFLNKVFNPNGTGQIPFKKLDVLWGVSRLDSALDKAINAKKPQRWRTDIDKLFA